MRKSDGTLHFFINGINVGKKINGVPAVLYGVVDVFGRAEGVTITGMSEYAMFSLTAFNTAREFNWFPKIFVEVFLSRLLFISRRWRKTK